MKIYVVGSHKNNFPEMDNIREKFFIDDKHTDDNIDDLNAWYCELTGMYHLWKNCDDDVVGLEHYRRYFSDINGKRLDESAINQLLEHNDIICINYNEPNTTMHYFTTNPGCDKNQIYRIIYNNPGSKDAFFSYFSDHNLVICNMFICKKELLNEYCEWLFKQFDFIALNENNKRCIGYIAEYIFGAWLRWKNKKINYQYLKLLH